MGFQKFSRLLVLTAVLAACGGGGGGITTSNLPPTASLIDTGAITTGSSVTLDGSNSKDPEIAPISYAWALVSSPVDSQATLPTANSPKVLFSPDIDGNYAVRLTVTDPGGLSNSTELTLKATSNNNAAPIVRSFTSSAAIASPGTAISFNWKVVDPNRDAVSCSFDPFGNGDAIAIRDCLSTQSMTYTYNTPGTYRPRLTAIDIKNTSSHAAYSQTITGDPTISVVSPKANAVVNQQLTVIATLTSKYDITSVIARIAGKSTPLLFSNSASCIRSGCLPGFTGVMDLSGVAKGEYTLEVIAQDIQNRQSRYYQTVNYDNLPALTVSSPINDSVATPLLLIDAACTDDGDQGCAIKVMNDSAPLGSGDSTLLSSVSGRISQTVDLSAYVGKKVNLTFVATDSLNQITQTTRSVYVENSSNLSAVTTVDGIILDAKDSRLLYKISGTQGDTLYIHERALNVTTNVPMPSGKRINTAYLSNFGAMLVTLDTGGSVLSARVYDWNRNVLYDLGFPNSAESLQVSGNYAIWSDDSQNLIRRDLGNLSNSTLSTSAGNWRNSVASSGTVAWWGWDGSGYQINLYNGTTTQITKDTTLWNTYVLTDGHNTVYRKHTPRSGSQSYALTLFNGTREITLNTANSIEEPLPGTDYQVRNNWVSYTDTGNLGQRQVWTYDPLGAMVQRTFFGASSIIETLGDSGQLMLTSGNKRYLSANSGSLVEINSDQGKSYEINSQWYVGIGRTFFAVKTP
jgi:PKD domain